MSQPRHNPDRNPDRLSPDETLFTVKRRKTVPYEFVLDAIAPLSPVTRSMFGCLAIYVGDKIVLILRDKREGADDNGVWLATTEEHHKSLQQEFPNMRSIRLFGKKQVTGWQVLPADAQDFEESAMRACELVLAGDARIGKVPGARRAKGLKGRKAAKAVNATKKAAKSAKAKPSKSANASRKAAKSRAR
jgi:hypothetical protein